MLNTELRWQTIAIKNSFLPLKVGVGVFYDVDLVWSNGEDDKAHYWHHGYVGGFYVTPFKEQFAFNISAGSSM